MRAEAKLRQYVNWRTIPGSLQLPPAPLSISPAALNCVAVSKQVRLVFINISLSLQLLWKVNINTAFQVKTEKRKKHQKKTQKQQTFLSSLPDFLY